MEALRIFEENEGKSATWCFVSFILCRLQDDIKESYIFGGILWLVIGDKQGGSPYVHVNYKST